jgi:ribA/ribD-fused uncharacterized protein
MRIVSFSNYHYFLSNFAPTPVEFDGRMYPTVEHAYQAAKSEDPQVRRVFEVLPSPRLAKQRGRAVRLRRDWDTVKVGIMRTLLERKFAPDSEMASKLLRTGSAELVEGNYWHDNFWGACDCMKCLRTPKQNVLGTLLMEVRDTLRAGGRRLDV